MAFGHILQRMYRHPTSSCISLRKLPRVNLAQPLRLQVQERVNDDG